nr:MAG TPA: repressor protein C2 [Caudoviricetes sp.]
MTSWNDRLKQVMQEKGVLAADLVRATGHLQRGKHD